MKKILLLFLFILPLALLSANDSIHSSDDTLSQKKLSIGISFSPDFCFRRLKSDQANQDLADFRNSVEIPKLGYTAGANIIWTLNKKLHIESGLLFSDNGERTKKIVLETVSADQQPVQYSFNYHYYYLSVPLKLNYYLLTRKLKLYVSAGLSINVFAGQKITSITQYANRTERINSKADPGFSRLNLSVLGGIGLSYPISKRADLNIEPVYRRSLTSIIDAPLKGYLYSAGLNVGIHYHF